MSVFDWNPVRTETDSMKWDVKPGELPMWVADMDFATCPAVQEAIEKRAAHGIYGYTLVPDSWYEAYRSWWQTRHNFPIQKDWLMFCTGVVPAISSMVRKLTYPAENVVVLSPVYNIFYNSIYNNGRNILESPLAYADGLYRIDWTDLEAKLADPQTSLLIFCNPHNPCGRIWTREELVKVADLCGKYGVTVISDEIHCDLTRPGKGYIPFASVSETAARISASCLSPSKAFNLAGLHTAAICVPDPFLRHKVWRGINTDEIAEPEVFACLAAETAYTQGAGWLDELNTYIYGNREIAETFIDEQISPLKVVKADATYLVWIDCSALTDNTDELQAFLREKTGLYLSEGSEYGTGGASFLRLNAACSHERLEEGLQRLKDGIALWQSEHTSKNK